jgi:hypothetical protein
MKTSYLLVLLGLLIAAIGCGGGSGGAGGGTSARGSLFMTDSLDTHDHVWITVNKVVLTGAGGNATVFDDTVGQTVDLKTLRDSSGERYAFLAAVPAGTYTGASVTVDKTVTLFSGGSSTGVTRVFAGNNGSTATLTIGFSTPRSFGPGQGFALDFNLADWNDDGTTITGSPFLREGQGAGLHDGSRHEHDGFHGVIQGLAGVIPTQSFNLVRGSHSTAVVTNAQTVIFNSNGAPSPTLTNGERVEVRGAFSVDQNAIVADSIKIRAPGDGDDDEQEVQGPVSDINAGAGTFVVTIDEAHHFIPTDTTVTVTTGASTVFVSGGGIILTPADFFAALANGQEIEVEGIYDANTNTLAATRVKLEDGENEDHDSQVKGPVSAINVPALTFDVTAQEWEGISLGANQVVHVVTNGSTVFEHGSMTASQFFAALTSGQQVEVEGVFDAGTSTMTAAKVDLEDGGGHH